GANPYDGLYFTLNLIQEDYTELKGYVMLDTGASADPAPAGLTKLATALVDDGDTDAENAAAIVAALQGSIYADLIKAETDPDVPAQVNVLNKIFGKVSDEGAGDSGFIYTLDIEALGGDLGKTEQGGVTLGFE